MPKINRGFDSLFEYLVRKNIPFTRRLDERLYPEEHSNLKYTSDTPYGRRWNPNPHIGQQMLGGLQPIADMIKDFVDTFKPYKFSDHAKKDLLQPISGLGNIVKGIINLLGAPVLFVGNTIRYIFISDSFSGFLYLYNIVLNIHRTASWMLDGVSSLVRGVTQIAATPLAWFIKMPLRGLVTAIKGIPSIEQNSGIQKLVAEGKTAVQEGKVYHVNAIRHELHRKYKKATERGQKTNIPKKLEEDFFRSIYISRHCMRPLQEKVATNALQYIGLFSTIHQEQQESLISKVVESCEGASKLVHEENPEHNLRV